MDQWRWSGIPAENTGRVGIEVLLDSVILIDHFNGITEATDYIRKTRGKAAISVITRAEVLAGYDNPSEAVVKMLDTFANLAIDTPIATLAAQLRRANRWKLPDAFQAALSRQNNYRLVTRNTRDFDPQKFDWVDVPYQLPERSMVK